MLEGVCRTRKKKKEKIARELGLGEDVFVSSEVGLEREAEATCIGSSEHHKLGPLDKWTRRIDPTLSSSESLQQQRIHKALCAEKTLQVQQYIARWVYTHAVEFNAIDNDEFNKMVEAIGQFGPGLKPHSQHDLRESLLKSKYEQTKTLLKERDEEKEKHGCSLMTNAWTDMKRRSIMNYLSLHSMMEKKGDLRKMAVDKKWDDLKDVHTKKGKDATATMLSITFWNGVNLCLKVFEEL
ncbi:hypothetical protein LINPERHAP1_LOCUS8769, partial [Linum perenne]